MAKCPRRTVVGIVMIKWQAEDFKDIAVRTDKANSVNDLQNAFDSIPHQRLMTTV